MIKHYDPQAVQAAFDILIKQNVNTGQSVKRGSDLSEALSLATIIGADLASLGEERLRKAAKITGNRNIIPAVANYGFPETKGVLSALGKLKLPVDGDEIKCGARALGTYMALAPYLDKLKEYRKLKALDRVL